MCFKYRYLNKQKSKTAESFDFCLTLHFLKNTCLLKMSLIYLLPVGMPSTLLVFVILLSAVPCLKGEEELVLVNEDGDSVDSQGRFPGHVVLRPDYTFWNMVNAIRNMFDMRTKKRWQRDLTMSSSEQEPSDRRVSISFLNL